MLNDRTSSDPGAPDEEGLVPGPVGWSTWQMVGVTVAVAVVVALLAVTISDRMRGESVGSVDVGFLQDMIYHHEQAIQLGVVAAHGATDDSVRDFGLEAVIAQQWEIGYMTALLDEWGLDLGDPDRDSMEWMGMPVALEFMPGMATPEQMENYRMSSGQDVDRLFLSLMRAHHLGGIHMARDAAKNANDPRVRDLAERMVKKQASEIAEYDARWEALGFG